ncbi:MAG TPA: deoxyguanosinetriphosphate triphosphohydrolase family protein [bacterium]|nr:deoxyguanosinetriphosphate triphosphohydrolase family protein [bacterium]
MMSAASEGREHKEPEHPYRTAFQRDRDRVIHSTAFRRLEYKTQVFVFHEGDHYRTRLTHTIEGAQIARTIARALRLNEELAEATILSHDLGHTPFGHSGQDVMNRLMKEHGGFEHNRQSLRIVTLLEHRYPAFPGLNLTYEVREGIAKHVSPYDSPQVKFKKKGHPTLEAQIVDLADEIAYCHHDLDDGLRSGLITVEQLKAVDLWAEHFERCRRGGDEKPALPVRGAGVRPAQCGPLGGAPEAPPPRNDEVVVRQTVRSILNQLVTDLVQTTEENIATYGIKTTEDVRKAPQKCVRLSAVTDKKNKQLKAFLYQNFYKHYRVERMASKAEKVLEDLFHAYLKNPKILPKPVQEFMNGTPKERVICDYIAGMTDRFALEEHARLFDPAVKV